MPTKTFKATAPHTYESATHIFKGVAMTWGGAQGSKINRWVVTDKTTGRIVATMPTLALAKETYS